MTTLNTGSRPHRPINTGTVWSHSRKLETVTFQMDTHSYEPFVWWGKRTWLAISQVYEDCFFFFFLRLQLSQSGQMSSRCGLQKIAHWSSKGSPLLLNRHCQIVQRENAFIFLRLSHLHRVLDFPTDVLDEEQTCTWQTDLYGQFRPGLNNLFGFWFDVEVSSQDTIALCNIHQALAWCWPGSADMTQQISSI